MDLCTAVLASGKNRGSRCGRKVEAGLSFCRYHKTNEYKQKEVKKDEVKKEFDEIKFINDLKTIQRAIQPLSNWIEFTRTFVERPNL